MSKVEISNDSIWHHLSLLKDYFYDVYSDVFTSAVDSILKKKVQLDFLDLCIRFQPPITQ